MCFTTDYEHTHNLHSKNFNIVKVIQYEITNNVWNYKFKNW